MNITFNGYVAFSCNTCKTKRAIEGCDLKFQQDTSLQAKKDEYIRYITSVNVKCVHCSGSLQLKLDVWEYPEAITNYAYYDEQGIQGTQCEFTIEHYFDDEALIDNAENTDEILVKDIEGENESELSFDGEDSFFDGDPDVDQYTDYD